MKLPYNQWQDEISANAPRYSGQYRIPRNPTNWPRAILGLLVFAALCGYALWRF